MGRVLALLAAVALSSLASGCCLIDIPLVPFIAERPAAVHAEASAAALTEGAADRY